MKCGKKLTDLLNYNFENKKKKIYTDDDAALKKLQCTQCTSIQHERYKRMLAQI